MRNLQLYKLVKKNVDLFSGANAFTQTSDYVYFINSNQLYKYDILHNSTQKLCEEKFEEVLQLKLLSFENKLCVVTKNSIHVIDIQDNKFKGTIQFVKEIAIIQWTSTEELVAIIFATGDVETHFLELYAFKCNCQGNSHVNANVPSMVYVGWGSKDTQFRGSEGKLKKKIEENVEDIKKIEDRKPTISWRENGEMFAVNYWKDHKRMFIVFEASCRPVFHSEDYPGMGPLIAWRPTGNMIATYAEKDSKKSIVIFEKNGQKRFAFEFSTDDAVITDIKWSGCAKILAVLTRYPNDSQGLTLMTTSNYKWFKKQELRFDITNKLLAFDWLNSTEFTFTIRVITEKQCLNYTFKTAIHRNDNAICGVIDGNSINLTDFKKAIIPPPLYSSNFLTENPINFIVFHKEKNQLVLVDCLNQLQIIDIHDVPKSIAVYNLRNLPEWDEYPLEYYNFHWSNDSVYFIHEKSVIILNVENWEFSPIFYSDAILENIIIKSDGSTTNLHCLKSLNYPSIYEFLPSEMDVVNFSVATINDVTFAFHLTVSNSFYIDHNRICDNCNSFIITEEYLLLTTKSSELYCIRLTCDILNRLKLDGRLRNFYHRNIEQGSSIVAVIPNTPYVVLQMPRGNIETVSCRLICIDILEKYLKVNEWSKALYLIETEKLNANLLIDLNPSRFLERIGDFVDAAKTVSRLNNICLEIEDANSLDTVYRNCILGKPEVFGDKCRLVFRKILDFFESIDYAPYISTIVIVNLHFFTLHDAMVYLKDLYHRSMNDDSLKSSLTNAVNILKTYGCVEQLYGEALLLYDLDLAKYMASCSQMDPRIYEPKLVSLGKLPEIEQRFEINCMMNRPKIAISYLLRCPDKSDDTIKTYIETHKISAEAYKHCPSSSTHFTTVSRAFARNLNLQRNYLESGLVLRKAKLHVEAFQQFMLGVHWREALDMLDLMQLNDEEKCGKLQDLANSLCRIGQFNAAAQIYEDLSKSDEAIRILLKNLYFVDAIRLANKHKRPDIIESELIPSLQDHYKYLDEKLNEMEINFNHLTNRLLKVRELKVVRCKINPSSDYMDENDTFSDMDSVTSRTSSRSSRTRTSTASSKNRRKEERKKQDLREGGYYEDIAIIRALHIMIKEIRDRGDEVRTTCYLLLQETSMSFAGVKKLHDRYLAFVNQVNRAISKIWPTHFYIHNPTQVPEEMVDLMNIEHLDKEYRDAPAPIAYNSELFN